jgi:hypothetical protein
MEHFVTFFNQSYLPQGIALHNSMRRHLSNYCLWVLCADDTTFQVLTKLKLENIKLLLLSNLETRELKEAKKNRNAKEYIWTLSPFAPRFVFESDDSINRVTYIDADLWFCKDPVKIFKEFERSGKSVMITDHAYAPEYDNSQIAGRFCVQFMIFTRAGEVVRRWWEDRCLEWCHEYYEEGKLGDQRYLDDWPERFESHVHILEDKELILAPWNATRFPFGNCIAWHFHGLRIAVKKTKYYAQSDNYVIPPPTYQNIYLPYIKDLGEAIKKLQAFEFDIFHQVEFEKISQMKKFLRGLYRLRWMTKINNQIEIN